MVAILQKSLCLLALFGLSTVVQASSEPVHSTKCSDQSDFPMCITAWVNSTEVTTYKLSLKEPKIGWMAMGFGEGMVGSPMVVMWLDGNDIVLSQRIATAHKEPKVDPNPPRIATVYKPLTVITDTLTELAFTMPTDNKKQEPIIFAYSTTHPSAGGTMSKHNARDCDVLDFSGNPSFRIQAGLARRDKCS